MAQEGTEALPAAVSSPAPNRELALGIRSIKTVMDEISDAMIERELEIELSMIALAAQQHLLLLGPPGCLAGDTLVNVNRGGNGHLMRIEDVVKRLRGQSLGAGRPWNTAIPTMVARADAGSIRLGQMADAWESGVKLTYELTTEKGRTIRATADHPFMMGDGTFSRLGDLRVGNAVCVNAGRSNKGRTKVQYRSRHTRFHPRQRKANGGFRVVEHQLAVEAELNGMSLDEFLKVLRTDQIRSATLQFLPPGVIVHHEDRDPNNNAPSNLKIITQSEHALEHLDAILPQCFAQVGTEKISAIRTYGEEMTYDMEVRDDPHNFVANGFIVHNTGKSYLARMIGNAVGGRFFERLLTKFTDPSEVFGPISVPRLVKQELFERNLRGHLADVEVAFLDEIFKASSAILNTLLTIINERVFHNGSGPVPVPLQTLFAASNEPPQDELLGALWDRFLIRHEVRPVSDPSLLLDDLPRPTAKIAHLDAVQAAVRKTVLPASIKHWMSHLKLEAAKAGIQVGDRRLQQSASLVKASSVLRARPEPDGEDLWVLAYTFWQTPDQIPTVERLVETTMKQAGHAQPPKPSTTPRNGSGPRPGSGGTPSSSQRPPTPQAMWSGIMAKIRKNSAQDNAGDRDLHDWIQTLIDSGYGGSGSGDMQQLLAWKHDISRGGPWLGSNNNGTP